MSKKIIYLLSLLMALSLVFASCKKNSSVTGGDVPGDEPDTTPPPTEVGGDGLFTTPNDLDLYKDKRVQASEVAKYANKNYMRNPVITVVGGSTVVVFYEVRYETPGSGNDVALTGNNVVDIAYTVSADAGVSFDTSAAIAGYVGGKASAAENSHGAPIVFKSKDEKKLIVVASAGIGLSSGTYNKEQNKVSKLDYCVGTVNGSTITFGSWKTINISDSDITGYNQFGTHSARGTVASDGTLLLPVTLANYTSNKFGYILYTGTINDSDVTWNKTGNVVDMPNNVKETRIVAGDNTTDYTFISVPGNNGTILYSGKGQNVPPTATTTISGGDGSAGTLVVKNWQGTTSYDPKAYDLNTGTKQQAVLSHVVGVERNLAIRLVDDSFKSQLNNSFELKANDPAFDIAKSSSIDILKDGTIVMAAEGGRVDTGVSARTYYIYFHRYTQAYLASQTGNAQ